jgi:hypothetical protein
MNLFLVNGTIYFLACGCAANRGLETLSDAETNQARIPFLKVGMNQDEVLCQMGPPHSREQKQRDQELIEVWFYATKPTVLGQSRLVPLNLTPLVFRNQVLAGWGYAYYRFWYESEDPPHRHQKESKEDKTLEKTLAPSSPQGTNLNS